MDKITHRYTKDGQERVVTGTQEEIDAEKAGVPWQPPMYPDTVEHLTPVEAPVEVPAEAVNPDASV